MTRRPRHGSQRSRSSFSRCVTKSELASIRLGVSSSEPTARMTARDIFGRGHQDTVTGVHPQSRRRSARCAYTPAITSSAITPPPAPQPLRPPRGERLDDVEEPEREEPGQCAAPGHAEPQQRDQHAGQPRLSRSRRDRSSGSGARLPTTTTRRPPGPRRAARARHACRRACARRRTARARRSIRRYPERPARIRHISR